MKKIKKYVLIKFFWITLERFPNLFRPSSTPYVSGDTFRKFSNHIFDETVSFDPNKVKKNDIIFLNSDLIEIYFKIQHPQIKNKYILITHNSDEAVSDRHINFIDSKIIKWFAQNLTIKNEKLSLIPIGLENLRRLKHGRKKWFKQKHTIKTHNILCSFDIYTNYSEREKIKNSLENEYIEFYNSKNTKNYFEKLSHSKYTICPPGNGPDTHRIWESLLLEVIPIMKIDKFTSLLREIGVPGLYINSWEEINSFSKNQLDEYYEKFKLEDFHKFTKFSYWRDEIISSKA
tara:strand:+ start:8630 stop:9496 length:867 start_codon:yes stop_codon:yes gene_type:complete